MIFSKGFYQAEYLSVWSRSSPGFSKEPSFSCLFHTKIADEITFFLLICNSLHFSSSPANMKPLLIGRASFDRKSWKLRLAEGSFCSFFLYHPFAEALASQQSIKVFIFHYTSTERESLTRGKQLYTYMKGAKLMIHLYTLLKAN